MFQQHSIGADEYNGKAASTRRSAAWLSIVTWSMIIASASVARIIDDISGSIYQQLEVRTTVSVL